MINIAMLQTDIRFCDPEYNFRNVEKLFAEAMEKPTRPDIVILPEDWSCGFSDEMFRNMEKYVEPQNGPSVSFLCNLAKKYNVWVVAGSIATQFSDGMRNTTFLINREGEIVGDYSKMHLYSDMDENVPFLNGDKTEVYDTELGKLAFMICYDIRFAELARTYALKKADVIIVTSDFPNPRVNHWKTLLTARAIENQMFVVACNRVGASPMGTYCGHSLIIDPWGDIIAEGGREQEIVTGSIDFTQTAKVRDLIHVFRDRQPKSYHELIKEN